MKRETAVAVALSRFGTLSPVKGIFSTSSGDAHPHTPLQVHLQQPVRGRLLLVGDQRAGGQALTRSDQR
jgi:hypothetical protein